MEQKAWIDVKSPRFYIWKAIQYVGVMVSGVKTLISPTSRQKYKAKKSCDIVHSSSKG